MSRRASVTCNGALDVVVLSRLLAFCLFNCIGLRRLSRMWLHCNYNRSFEACLCLGSYCNALWKSMSAAEILFQHCWRSVRHKRRICFSHVIWQPAPCAAVVSACISQVYLHYVHQVKTSRLWHFRDLATPRQASLLSRRLGPERNPGMSRNSVWPSWCPADKTKVAEFPVPAFVDIPDANLWRVAMQSLTQSMTCCNANFVVPGLLLPARFSRSSYRICIIQGRNQVFVS